MTIDNRIRTIAQYQNLIHYCDQLTGRNILVVGDIMVDEYIWGEVQRISPEAPVPVVRVKQETSRLGGAANVVNNLRSLEANVALVGVVGKDDLGDRVIRYLDNLSVDSSGIVQAETFQTIRKSRIVAHNQQVVRVDRENTAAMTTEIEQSMMDACRVKLASVDAVVISDYAKGAITPGLAREVIRMAREAKKICAVDPKVRNIANYKYCTVITPNHIEAMQIAGLEMGEPDVIERAGKHLLASLSTDAVLITCGEQGMALFEKDKPMEMIETVAKSVYDVTGAGDTAISALTLALASRIPVKESAILANFAAGVVVGKFGTATASIDEIKKAMQHYVA
ncbi:D-glycero-beta-D-manno-heptose-7-phosphate kinase [bacterium]|nr:D-glycero-beta-D-manno-heptose-7-phosphate kinase [candidate division CSSED10-310 bacterium]